MLEVKGCTLVDGGHVKFPDASTLKGKRHVEELIKSKKEGFNAAILFLITCEDAESFSPNFKMDPDFSNALEKVYNAGVNVIAYSFKNNYKNRKLEMKPFKRVKIKYLHLF